MPRIRTLKPEFWADEKLSLLDATTRLVFLGLVSMADDAGRLVDNVKLLDGMLFPNTDDSCRDPLDILARIERIIRYQSESGQALIQVTNWHKHQRVDNPSKYTLPGPETAVATLSRDSSEDDAKPSPSDLRPTTPDLGPTTERPRADGDAVREYALALTARANAAARQKWRTEPWMAGSVPSFTMCEELITSGILLPDAQQRLVTQIEASGMPNPPRSMRYFLPGCLEANAASPRPRRSKVPPQQFDYSNPTEGDVTWAK